MTTLVSEVEKLLDLSVIRYSRVWEDHKLLEEALNIVPNDVILSITSSGDNVLNLLLQEPKSIVAIDMSASQNAVLELKIAAINNLTHTEFVQLFGIRPATAEERIALYERIKGHLPSYAQTYWSHNTSIIGSGIAKAGRLEKYFDAFHSQHLAPFISAELLDKLVSLPTLQEQKEFATKHIISNPEIEKVFKWYFGEETLKKQGRDPAQMRFIEGDIADYNWSAFCKNLTTHHYLSNPYMHVFWRGEYWFDLETAQPYLRPSNYERLKSLLPRVQIVTGSIETHLSTLTSPSVFFTKANLSDIFEYMSQEAADALFLALASKFEVGGRLAFWNLFVPRCPSASLRTHFKAHPELSQRLHDEDRLFFYSAFHVEEVIKN